MDEGINSWKSRLVKEIELLCRKVFSINIRLGLEINKIFYGVQNFDSKIEEQEN